MVIDTSTSLLTYDPPDSWAPTRYGNFLPTRRDHDMFLPHKEPNGHHAAARTARVADPGMVYTKGSRTESLGAAQIGLVVDVYA